MIHFSMSGGRPAVRPKVATAGRSPDFGSRQWCARCRVGTAHARPDTGPVPAVPLTAHRQDPLRQPREALRRSCGAEHDAQVMADYHLNWLLAILPGLAVGADLRLAWLLGGIRRGAAFIVTLAGMLLLRGGSQYILNAQAVPVPPDFRRIGADVLPDQDTERRAVARRHPCPPPDHPVGEERWQEGPVVTGQDSEVESVKLITAGERYSTINKDTQAGPRDHRNGQGPASRPGADGQGQGVVRQRRQEGPVLPAAARSS